MAFSVENEFVDQHYQFLVKAMKRKAEEWLSEEASVIYSRIVRESLNTAWMILCMKGVDMPLVLLYGMTLTAPELRELSEEGDVGITISSMPFGKKLLPLMSMAASLKDDSLDSCECGHQFDPHPMINARLGVKVTGAVCPACGTSTQDMDAWELSD